MEFARSSGPQQPSHPTPKRHLKSVSSSERVSKPKRSSEESTDDFFPDRGIGRDVDFTPDVLPLQESTARAVQRLRKILECDDPEVQKALCQTFLLDQHYWLIKGDVGQSLLPSVKTAMPSLGAHSVRELRTDSPWAGHQRIFFLEDVYGEPVAVVKLVQLPGTEKGNRELIFNTVREYVAQHHFASLDLERFQSIGAYALTGTYSSQWGDAALAFVMPYAAGTPIVSLIGHAQSDPSLLQAGVQGTALSLADLHSNAPRADGPPSKEWLGDLFKDVDRMLLAIENSPEVELGDLGLELRKKLARSWMRSANARAQGVQIHGDANPGNFMFDRATNATTAIDFSRRLAFNARLEGTGAAAADIAQFDLGFFLAAHFNGIPSEISRPYRELFVQKYWEEREKQDPDAYEKEKPLLEFFELFSILRLLNSYTSAPPEYDRTELVQVTIEHLISVLENGSDLLSLREVSPKQLQLPPTPPQAIYFDYDGVGGETRRAQEAAFPETVRHFGGSLERMMAYSPRDLRRMSHEDFIAALELKNCTPEQLLNFWLAKTKEHLKPEDLNPELVPLIATLKERGIKVVFVTNGYPELVWHCLKMAGVKDLEDLVVDVLGRTATNADDLKPSPAMLNQGAKLLDVLPQNAWMIGDSTTDREAADAANLACFVGLGTPGDVEVASLHELHVALETYESEAQVPRVDRHLKLLAS